MTLGRRDHTARLVRGAWGFTLILVVVAPAASVALQYLLSWITGRRSSIRGARLWWLAMLPGPALLVSLALVSGRPRDALLWAGIVAVVALLGFLGAATRREQLSGVVLSLLAVVLLALYFLTVDALRFGPVLLFWAPDTVDSVAERSFWTPTGADGVRAMLGTRRLPVANALHEEPEPGVLPADWVGVDGVEIAPGGGPGQRAGVRITVPDATADPYAYLAFDTGLPAGGRTFRAIAQLRSESPLPASGSRGLWLQSWDPAGSTTRAVVELGPDWVAVAAELTLSPAVNDAELLVVINDFDGWSVEVSRVEVQEWIDGKWQPLPPIARLTAGEMSNAVAVGAALTLERSVVELPGSVPRGGQVALRVHSNGWRGLVVDELAIGAVEGAAWWLPVIPYARVGWWLGHPNTAGHVVALLVAGALLLVASRSHAASAHARCLLWMTLVLGGSAVLLTGSRSSWVAYLLLVGGYLTHVGWTWGAGARVWVRALIVTFLVAAVGLVGGWLWFADGSPLDRGNVPAGFDGNVVGRTEIWRFAVGEMMARPLSGHGGRPFAEVWDEAGGGPSLAHAHNAVLTLGSRYGVPGAMAGIWPLAVLGFVLVARRRWLGVTTLAALLVLQGFDDTLWTLQVLVPLRWMMIAVMEQET